MNSPSRHWKSRSPAAGLSRSTLLCSLLAIALPTAVRASCIPLANSTQCPAFSTASISTDASLVALYPFLQFVTTTANFDTELASYVKTSYVQLKYQTLLGCKNIDLTNTTELYARYTTSVLCNGIIQNSRNICGLSPADAKPLCADSCALYAESEEKIIVDTAICSGVDSTSNVVQSQIRSDFTVCALPSDSLSGSCVLGSTNEPSNCGFGNSTFGLCQYCSAGGENSTDTCCYNSNVSSRCAGVVLPTISPTTMTFTSGTSTPTSTPTTSTGSNASHGEGGGLSAGAKAGIAIGAILGFLALVALIVLAILFCRRRRAASRKGSNVFNQPTPARKSIVPNGATYNAINTTAAPKDLDSLPAGRIARMSALEPQKSPPLAGPAAAGAAAGAYAGRSSPDDGSSSGFAESPKSARGVLRPPPNPRRQGSLSSNSALGEYASSPTSPREVSSPPGGLSSQQSEQLAYFKDYYSQGEIHPGSRVATLWAYQPRAADEFALERGDMLKVVGIWDDGWATGVLIDQRAEEWDEAQRSQQRDSGVASGEAARRASAPEAAAAAGGEIRAFPLVCVCLPEHWRKTVDGGDGSTESGSQGGGGTWRGLSAPPPSMGTNDVA